MKYSLNTKEYTLDEFCNTNGLEVQVQKYGSHDYIAFINNVKRRNMRGETLKGTGISPITSINNYIKNISKSEISITNTKPHTRIIVPKLHYLPVTDLTTCKFCIGDSKYSIINKLNINPLDGGYNCSYSCPHCKGNGVVTTEYDYPISTTNDWIAKYGLITWVPVEYYSVDNGQKLLEATPLMLKHGFGLTKVQTVTNRPSPPPQKRSLLKKLLGIK